MTLLAEAVAWYQAGYMPLPIRPDGSKRPTCNWKQYQDERPDIGTIINLFGADHDGLGLICGASSGHLEMLELEGRAVTEGLLPALAQAFADHDMAELWQRIDGGYSEATPSGGIHWYYRVQGGAQGNAKLARRPSTEAELAADPDTKIQVLIETRGQGGFTVIAPSAGRTHDTGNGWRVMSGGRDRIPTLTPDEVAAVHAVAGVLDQMPDAEPQVAPSARPRQPGDPKRPGDDFNERATWEEILTPHGWKLVRRSGQYATWARPGKRSPGISATTGKSDTGDRLFVFSTSTDFEQEKPYNKFGAYALLNHGGDHAAAAKALAADGYGDQSRETTINLLPPLTINDPAPPIIEGSVALKIDQNADIPRAATTTLTDQGNADILADMYADQLRYVPSRGQWITWTGSQWAWCDDAGEATQAAVATIRAIQPNGDKAIADHVRRSLSKRSIEAMVALASRHPAMRVTADALDANPWILNTPAGLIDLRDGTLRDATADDLCTRSTTVTAATEPPARLLAFLEDTFNDPAMVAYVQRLAGYSALGVVLHHVLPFLHGSGGNGKSVFLDVLVSILGDYASTAPPSFLMAGRQDESAIARLAGLRLVVCSEVSQSARFDEAKVKLLTGGDKITARFLYGRHFTFTPSATLWLMGNHQPRVEAGGESFWRRLRLVPFTRTVPVEKRVEGLAQQLVDTEGPQILGWIIEGCRQVLAAGMQEPESVMAATRSYAEEEDALARFVSDRILLGGGSAAREPTTRVRAAYAQWCKAEGESEVSPQVFARELRTRWHIGTTRTNSSRFYTNMTLYADEEEGTEWWKQ